MPEEPTTTTPATDDGKLAEALINAAQATKGDEGAQGGDTQGKPPKQQEPAPPKTFTEEEVNQRIETIKGGHEGTVKKMREEHAETQRLLTESQALGLQMEYDNWMRALREEAGGEQIDFVKAVAALDKNARERMATALTKEKEVNALKADLDSAGKAKFVGETLAKYGVSQDYFEELCNMDDRGEIKARAADLALEKTKAEAVPVVKIDKGEGKPVPRDLSKMPGDTALGLLMEEAEAQMK